MTPARPQIEALAASLGAFIALLRQEGECLTKKDPDKLSQILDEKNHLTTTMGEQWLALCDLLGLPNASPKALEARLAERGDQTVLELWRDVSRLSSTAREMNEQNGALIRLQLIQTGKAIDILQAASHQNATYGPNGLSSGELSYTRTIDKA